MKNNELIKLFELPGISGRENLVRELVKKELKKANLEIISDNLGSIFGIKKSSSKNAKKLLIDAHMDEVGLMVTDINSSGMLRFDTVGYIWEGSLAMQRVRVYNKELTKFVPGIVTFDYEVVSRAPKAVLPELEDFFIDVGASNRKEVEAMGIRNGCVVVFDTSTIINKDVVFTKAADNRVGVALVLDLLSEIKNKKFDYDIIIGCSSQEEVGLRGARTIAYKVNPDMAIIIDNSPAKDTPSDTGNGALNAGTFLRHMDRSTIYPKKAIDYLSELMNKKKIKYQDYFSQGGTNAGIVHLTKEGVFVLGVGLLVRHLHTGSSIFNLNDYKNTLQLLREVLLDLNTNKISNLTKK